MQNEEFIKNVELFMRETEDSVNKLHRSVKLSSYKTLTFTSATGNGNYLIKALNSCQGYIEIIPNVTESVNVEIKLNGVLLYNGLVSKAINLYSGFYQGVTEISVNASENAGFILKVYGNLDYVDGNTIINVAKINNENFVVFFDGNSVKTYVELNSVLILKNELKNVIQGSVVNVKGNCIEFSYVDNLNNAYLYEYNVVNNTFNKIKELGYKANCVFGYYDNEKYTIFAMRLNTVYKSSFKLTDAVSFTKINVLGKKGYLDYQTKSAFITVDSVDVARLVIINSNAYSVYNLPIGSNYHLYKIDNGYKVTYFDKVAYRSLTFINGKITVNADFEFCREAINYDNKKVVYTNGEINIRSNI